MDNKSELDLVALKGYKNELEAFRVRVTRYCTELEGGIAACSSRMLDTRSQAALKNGRRVAAKIKAYLNPVDVLLDRVEKRIRALENENGIAL